MPDWTSKVRFVVEFWWTKVRVFHGFRCGEESRLIRIQIVTLAEELDFEVPEKLLLGELAPDICAKKSSCSPFSFMSMGAASDPQSAPFLTHSDAVRASSCAISRNGGFQ